MGRSLIIRYSAVTCIAAGGLFMGGTGAVAFADTPPDTPGDGTDGVDPNVDTQAPEPAADPRGFRIPKWLRLPGFGMTQGEVPKVGFIAPPLMNLPATLQSTTTRKTATVTLPFVIDNATKPAGSQSAGAAVVPDNSLRTGGGATSTAQVDGTTTGQVEGIPTQQVDGTSTEQDKTEKDKKPAAATTRREPPTINLVSLVPRGVPMGPPLTIKNPLRELLAPDLNFDAPITEQLLPTPLVALLNAVSQEIPLAGLLIAPVMGVADMFIPLLLSDVVVPTLPLATASPAPIPSTHLPMGKPVQLWARNESPPAELALMGMDVFQAPAAPPPFPLSFGVEKPQAPPPPPSPDPGVAPLSNPVAYRAGYSDYLRNAGMAQITAIAVPGAAAILLFSLGGGFIGYRQARAGHVIRAEGIARFLR